MSKELTTKDAVLHVLKETKCSKYWLAQQLGKRPIMISNYIKTTKPSRMSVQTAAKFTELFGIKIIDIYNPIKAIPDDDTKGLPGSAK